MKVLFLSASPLTAAHLDIELEAKAIKLSLERSRHRDAIQFIDESAVSPGSLVELVASIRPQVLHFSGHGERAGIVLRDGTNGSQVVRSGSLQRVLENRGVELLVLNACYSDEHADSALLSVQAVIGTVNAVEDRIATAFSEALYGCLGNGRNLKEAFEYARLVADASGGDRNNFILRGNEQLCFVGGGGDAAPPPLPPASAIPNRNRISKRGRPGVSHCLGSIHLHIDGPQATDFVRTTLASHEEEGYTAEFSTVCGFVAGSQREDEPDLYGIHTPGREDKEELEFFSTTVLYNGPGLPSPTQWHKIVGTTRDSLVRLFDFERQRKGRERGVVVELERVVGNVGVDGAVSMATPDAIDEEGRRTLLGQEKLLFTPNYPAGGDVNGAVWYELHFSLDFPKSTPEPPLTLERLTGLTRQARLDVGGWFLFQDTERWAYRSNGFETQVSPELLDDAWRRLRDCLGAAQPALPQPWQLRLLAEESLAVWKSPLVKSFGKIMTVPELATWEASVFPLSEFWVVAPNFLGDSVAAVAKAMVHNMTRGARYVYFLRSSADARRWLSLKSEIAAYLERSPPMDAYIVEFDDDFWANNMAFIANPLPQAGEPREAMLLRSDGRSRRIIWGSPMPPAQIDELCERLCGGIRNGQVRRWEHVINGARSVRLAALHICMSPPLAGAAADRFDELLAKMVSINLGEVVEYRPAAVVVIFHQPGGNVTAALRCAADLESTLQKDAGQLQARYGIDAGEATGAVRANGAVWQGPPLEGCVDLVERHAGAVPEGAILISAGAAAMLDLGKDTWPDLQVGPGPEGSSVATLVATQESAAVDMVHVADTTDATDTTDTTDMNDINDVT